MGSPLGPVLANIFMCHFEERWVTKGQIRPSLWYRYVDDTFTMFESKDPLKETLLIQELKPALNVNVSGEKLVLY